MHHQSSPPTSLIVVSLNPEKADKSSKLPTSQLLACKSEDPLGKGRFFPSPRWSSWPLSLLSANELLEVGAVRRHEPYLLSCFQSDLLEMQKLA